MFFISNKIVCQNDSFFFEHSGKNTWVEFHYHHRGSRTKFDRNKTLKEKTLRSANFTTFFLLLNLEAWNLAGVYKMEKIFFHVKFSILGLEIGLMPKSIGLLSRHGIA